jgi:hypothetical protein
MPDQELHFVPFVGGVIPIKSSKPIQPRLAVAEAEASRQKGFCTAWRVFADYELKNYRIRPMDTSHVAFYAPSASESLIPAIIRVAANDLDPLAFVRQYGLFGYAQLKSRQGIIPDQDPVEWFLAHARTIAAAVNLIGELQSDDEHALSDTIRRFSNGPYAEGTRIYKLTAHPAVALADSDPVRAAHLLLQSLINPNLIDIHRELVNVSGRSKSFFTFNAMASVVYWRISDSLVEGDIRRCAECGRFFQASDKRQKYCPRFPGAQLSRCSVRKNVRDYRGRKRPEKGE